MNVPDTFTFYHHRSDTLYTAYIIEFIDAKDKYMVTWEGCSNPVEYPRNDVERCLREGVWNMVSSPTNNREAIHLLEKRW